MKTDSRVFAYRQDSLHAEEVALADIAARFGTPTFVYSRAALVQAYREFASAAPGRRLLVCYAIKANSNLAVLDCLAREGAGFDIVSGGELKRVLAAGGRAERTVFSGVGKSAADIREALAAGVRCFNVESAAELHRLDAIARDMNTVAPVSLRVNPDVDARTHPYISTGLRDNKFGIAHEQAVALYRQASQLAGIRLVGIDCHIGSQITELAPFLAALDRVLDLLAELRDAGIRLSHIDLGGGLGIAYADETPPPRADLIRAVCERLDERLGEAAGDYELMFEFGRAIAGPAGVLLTRVEYLKPTPSKQFAIIDAAMNDLLRPSLYGAYHRVWPVAPRQGATRTWDLVGPICESGDWLARDRELALEAGDLLALADAGAYGMAMSSNYNSRGRAAEVMVDGAQALLVRKREDFEHQIAGERRLPD
ncbi:MAG: diaminopimelate decarboxylase [Burkholderiaceae bacterium]